MWPCECACKVTSKEMDTFKAAIRSKPESQKRGPYVIALTERMISDHTRGDQEKKEIRLRQNARSLPMARRASRQVHVLCWKRRQFVSSSSGFNLDLSLPPSPQSQWHCLIGPIRGLIFACEQFFWGTVPLCRDRCLNHLDRTCTWISLFQNAA